MYLNEFIKTAIIGKTYTIKFEETANYYFNYLFENEGKYIFFEFNDGIYIRIPDDIYSIWTKIGLLDFFVTKNNYNIDGYSFTIIYNHINSPVSDIKNIISKILSDYKDKFEIEEDEKWKLHKNEFGVDSLSDIEVIPTMTLTGCGLIIEYSNGTGSIEVDSDFFVNNCDWVDYINDNEQLEVKIAKVDDEYCLICKNKVSLPVDLSYFEDCEITVIEE